ncbi:MAG: outer membrane protein assembly factor BamE [Aeromonas sp.]
MSLKSLLLAALTALTLSGCGLVYRIDIPQGNYVEQKQVDKLRHGMTPEQVTYVLGSPMLRDSFSRERWYYLYEFTAGNGDKLRQEFSVTFSDGKLHSISGDLPAPAAFNTPL